MLSKKMAFSLTSLITIFTLALVVLSSMAFDATFSVDSVSSSSGYNAEYAQPIVVTLHFSEKVDGAAAILTILIEDEYGSQTPITAPDINAKDIDLHTDGPQNNSQTFVFTIPGAATDADDVRVHLHVAAALPDLNPGSDLTSNAGTLTIDLVGPDPAASEPTVIGIETTPKLLIPADGYTGGAFDIVITLSEKPRAFRKDHISVDKGIAGDPVYLGAVEPPSGETATGRSGNYHRYLVKITPKVVDGNLVIKIKSFEDQEKPMPNTYIPPVIDFARVESRDILTVKIKRATAAVEVDRAEDENRIAPSVPTQVRVGATPIATTADEKAKPDDDKDTSVSIPAEGGIYISEIMFAGGGFLPQWIEIANGSRTEQVNLSGWTLKVENGTADADVFVSAKAKFRIPEGTRIDSSGQHATPSTLLIVAKQGRTNLKGEMAERQVINLDIFRSRPRYALLSDMAFKITLSPPTRPIVPEWAAARDVVGNLADDGTAAWALTMNESGGRSSIIRRNVLVSMGTAEPKDGTMLENWVLASNTKVAAPTDLGAHSYYGFPTDIGTPGFRAGGALPVELSHFRPARQKDSGAVVITWSTQSELNNAGFFLKRCRQAKGQFEIINATLIPGAGTTSEKQFYTYEDTTAQPNVVYYYQIEDVSLDGNRQTLTRGIRLKGYVGAAGKATTLWGELKRTN